MRNNGKEMKITPSALTEFFKKGGQFKNKNGVTIRMAENVFNIAAMVEDSANDDGAVYELYDEVAIWDTFFERSAITSCFEFMVAIFG